MARKPRKKPGRKTPSINQRLNARAKRRLALDGPTPPHSLPRHKPDVRIDKAQLAWEQRRFDEAIRYYESALARDPRNPVLLVDVARAYALRFRYEEAEKLVTLAESLHPANAHLQQMLGRSYLMLQQFDRAIACYRRALALDPTTTNRPQILLELARMHERLHDLDAARACAEEALTLAPGFEKARYILATIARRSGDLVKAESLWRDIISARRAPPGVIAESHYQLSSMHDATGDFASAIQELSHAKQILSRAALPYQHDATTIARIARKTFGTISPEHCERWYSSRDTLPPIGGKLALLTSHPRSGTTMLEQVLDSHPRAISADELQIMVEMVYIPLGRASQSGSSVVESLDCATPDAINAVRRAYWSSMEGALREPIGGRLLVDKNPELTMLLPLVARVFPEMKIVFALRDPRDVVVSCFTQSLPLNAVSVNYLTLEGTVKKYAATMRAWLKIRDMLRNPWIEVRYEETVANLADQARRVLEFLELPWDDAVLDFHQRAQRKHVHSPTYEAVTKPVYTSSIRRWRNYEEHLEPYLDTLRPFLDAFGYS